MRFCLHICFIRRKGQLGMSLFELSLSFSFLVVSSMEIPVT